MNGNGSNREVTFTEEAQRDEPGTRASLHEPPSTDATAEANTLYKQHSVSEMFATAMVEDEVPKNCCVRCSFALEHAIANALGNIGYKVAMRPWFTICTSLLVAAALGCGWAVQNTESRPEKLWIPQGSRASEDETWVEEYFPSAVTTGNVLCYGEGANILEADNLKECWRSWVAVMETKTMSDEPEEGFEGYYSWDGRDIGGEPTTAVCAKLYGVNCDSTSIFDIWDMNDTVISELTQDEIDSAIESYLDTDITNSNGKAFSIITVSAGLDSETLSAEALSSTYYISESDQAYLSEDALEVDPILEPLLLAHYDVIGSTAWDFTVVNWSWQTTQWEFDNALGGDIILMVFAINGLLTYMFIALGRRDPVYSSRWLGVAGCISIGMSIVGGLGFLDICGLDRTPLTQSLYFLLMGLGVDDAFIMHGEFMNQCRDVGTDENGKSKLSIPELIKLSMERAGLSILVTTVTDVVAFGIGASSSLPALAGFCVGASVCILFVFLFTITFFTACVTLDAYRTEPPNQRHEFFPCTVAEQRHERFASAEDQVGCIGIPGECLSRKYGCCPRTVYLCNCAPDLGKRFMENYLGPFVLMCRYPIIAAFALLFGFGIWGAVMIEQEFQFVWFLPEDSQITTWYDLRNTLFGDTEYGYSIYLGDIDYFDQESTIMELSTELSSKDWAASDVDSFVDAFSTYREAQGLLVYTADSWYTELNTWLSGSGAAYAASVVWADSSDATAGIVASRLQHSIKSERIVTSTGQKEMLETVRNDADAIMPYPDQRTSGGFFVYWEQYAVIEGEFWTNVGLAFACVAVIISTLIPNPRVAILVFCCVIASIFDLIGFLHHWGGSINSVSTIYMVASIGLTVDYAAHTGHGFLYIPGDKEERVIGTLGRVGVSVLNGGISTLIATCVLALATTYVFEMFFKCYFLCCIFGLGHGMLLLPALLSLVGPDTVFGETNEHEFPSTLTKFDTGHNEYPSKLTKFDTKTSQVEMQESQTRMA